MTKTPIAAIGAFLAGSALYAGPCQSISVSVVISPTYTFGGTSAPSAILPDGNGAYTDGVSGVGAHMWVPTHSCDGNLVLNVSNSTRQIGWSFQNAIVPDAGTPSWTSTPFMTKGDYLIVTNLFDQYNAAAFYTFNTSAVFEFDAPDGTVDSLAFDNPNAAYPNPQVNAAEANQPYNTALVVVTHSPADPSTGAVETWTITPSNANTNPSGTPVATQLGTLLLADKKGYVNAGQFSVPFQFIVTRK